MLDQNSFDSSNIRPLFTFFVVFFWCYQNYSSTSKIGLLNHVKHNVRPNNYFVELFFIKKLM